MSDLGLTAAVEAAARARWEHSPIGTRRAWEALPEGFRANLRSKVSVSDITAAAPLIEAAVRERIAADIDTLQAGAESNDDRVTLRAAARIARGEVAP